MAKEFTNALVDIVEYKKVWYDFHPDKMFGW
jgi:hypothetical protein